jgi:hypothetical protein
MILYEQANVDDILYFLPVGQRHFEFGMNRYAGGTLQAAF